MSFAAFGPLPRPQPNPIPGLPALEAAIRRLEATIIPTPAGQETGGTLPTPAGQETVGTLPTPAGQETSGTPPTHASTQTGAPGSSAVWQVVAKLLAQIDPDVRCYLHRLFERVLEAAEADLTLPLERHRLAPRPVPEQQQRRPCVKALADLRQHSQREVVCLLRQALWGAVDALEAAVLLLDHEYLVLLVEQCRQFCLAYEVLKKRAGQSDAAAWIVLGEIRMLHHRGSSMVEQILLS